MEEQVDMEIDVNSTTLGLESETDSENEADVSFMGLCVKLTVCFATIFPDVVFVLHWILFS